MGACHRIGFIHRISLDERTGCWNWRGPVDKGGYGKTKYNGKFISAHRLSAILWLRIDRNDPRQVMHKCDNPSCFNPKHLAMGTRSENALDSVHKGRQNQIRKTHCKNGHPYNVENTRIIRRPDRFPQRHCKICEAASMKKYFQKKKGERPSAEILHLVK